MTKKERLLSLVEQLPDQEVHAALRFVEYLRGESLEPVTRTLRNAPLDDEPVTKADLDELEAAEQDWMEGQVVSHAEARLELLRET